MTAAPIKDDALCNLHVMYTGLYIMHASRRGAYLLCACVSRLPEVSSLGHQSERSKLVHTYSASVCVNVCVCGRRRPKSKVSELGASRTHGENIFWTQSQRRCDGVPRPCQFISAALAVTYLQYVTFSGEKGLD